MYEYNIISGVTGKVVPVLN